MPSRKKYWQGWSDLQIEYMKWLVAGNPRETKADIARKIGVKTETLDRWATKPGFWDMVATLTDQSLHRARPKIYKRLIHAATKTEPDIAAAKLLLEILGDYGDPRKKSKIEAAAVMYSWEGENEPIPIDGEETEDAGEDQPADNSSEDPV